MRNTSYTGKLVLLSTISFCYYLQKILAKLSFSNRGNFLAFGKDKKNIQAYKGKKKQWKALKS